MEFQLGSKVVNSVLLSQEMDQFQTWQGYKQSGGIYYAVVSDLSEQSEIQATFDAHDGTQLTPEQKSQIAEKNIRNGIVRSKQSLHLIAPIYQQRSIDLNRPYGEITAIDAYNNVKTVMDSTLDPNNELGMFLINLIRNICWQHYNISYDVPPDPMTTNYANKFLQAVYELIDSINSQFKF